MAVSFTFFCVMVCPLLADPPPPVENFREVSERLSSGGEPVGDAAFAELARRGIRWIVSVDGAPPDVKTAARHGIRYVHIPIGYDGVPPEAALKLARVAREAKEGVFVHCHHGKHRGPAATAILWGAQGGPMGSAACDLLESAGTSRKYRGLWRDVEAFQIPDAGADLPALVSVAPVDPLVLSMADLGRHWDALHASTEVNPETRDELAVLIAESLRESERFGKDRGHRELSDWLAEAAEQGRQLADATSHQRSSADVDALIARLRESCDRCHARYRDNLE